MSKIVQTLLATALICSLAKSEELHRPALRKQGVGNRVSIEVDRDYQAVFTFGSTYNGSPITESLMLLLNLEATLVTSLTCKNCQLKVYNVSNDKIVEGGIYNESYPMPGINISFNGNSVYDSICLDDKATDKICTPIQKDEAFKMFAIETQNTGQEKFSYAGFVGLTPSENATSKHKSLGQYLSDMDYTDLNTISLMKYPSTGNTLVSFGTLKDDANYTLIDYNRQNGFWSFNIEQSKLGEHTISSKSTQAIVANSYPYLMYQTSDQSVADQIGKYVQDTFPNITFQNNSGAYSAKFLSTPCSDIKIGNLTLTTQFGSNGKELHIGAKQLLIDMADFSCALAFTVLVSPDYTNDRLILGQAFLNSFNITMKYEEKKIGFQGGYMLQAPDMPGSESALLIIIALVLTLAIVGSITALVIRKQRREKLARNLNTMENEGLM